MKLETNKARIIKRLAAEGWELARRGAEHDVWKHPKKGAVTVPRHNTLSPGVARSIAKAAGWI